MRRAITGLITIIQHRRRRGMHHQLLHHLGVLLGGLGARLVAGERVLIGRLQRFAAARDVPLREGLGRALRRLAPWDRLRRDFGGALAFLRLAHRRVRRLRLEQRFGLRLEHVAVLDVERLQRKILINCLRHGLVHFLHIFSSSVSVSTSKFTLALYTNVKIHAGFVGAHVAASAGTKHGRKQMRASVTCLSSVWFLAADVARCCSWTKAELHFKLGSSRCERRELAGGLISLLWHSTHVAMVTVLRIFRGMLGVCCDVKWHL